MNPPPDGSAVEAPDPSDDLHPTSRRRVRLLPIVAVVALVLVVWAMLAAVSVVSAATELERARGHLSAAERQLRDAELSRAREELDLGVTASREAARTLSSYHLVPLRHLPWVGPNLRAATTLSIVATDVGTSVTQLLAVAGTIVSDERTQDPGEISLEYLAELAPPTREVSRALQRGYREISALETEGLIARVDSARGLFLELVEPNLEQAFLAADLLEVAPSFLGEQGERRYLVGAAALSELRGSGGLIGSWSVLTAREGRMSFEEFVDVDDLPSYDGQVDAPNPDFARRYARFGALDGWRNTNLSPDFPAVAEVILQRYEAAGGAAMDGVIIADTVVFERLAERSGGIEVPGFERLAPDEVLRFVGLEAYDSFDDDDERKRVLGAVAAGAFAELFLILEDDDVPRTVEMLTALAADDHLKVYVLDGRVQGVMERAGVSGALPIATAESAGVYVNNFGENKIDFFAERRIEHHVRFGDGGTTESEVLVRLLNKAPTDGHRRAVLGPWMDGLEAGDSRSLVTFSCGMGCRVESSPEGAWDGGLERGRPMVDTVVVIPSMGEEELRFRTSAADGWHEVDGRLFVQVQHLVQPTIGGTELLITVEVPDGYRVIDAGAALGSDRQVIWEGRASGPVQLDVVLEPVRSDAGMP